jgi:hypothetical protein
MQDEKLSKTPGFVNIHGGYDLEQALASVGPGWAELVRAFFQACEDAGVEIVQVKEKFGGLRMYTGNTPEHIWDLIADIERKSYKTCEDCGKRGKLRAGGWVRTLCDEHAEERPASSLFS